MLKVSAIIPSLGKRPDMLAEAVKSIKAQTMPVLEIIVMDYPDNTFGNQSRRLNEGIKKSKGDAFFFLGDDDMLMPNFVEKLVSEMDTDRDWDIVTSGFENFGEETGVHHPGPFPLCSTLTKRSIYDKTQGFDEEVPIGIDADFYFQCFEAGAKWKIIEDVLFKSRVHKEQYSRTGDWANYKEIIHRKYGGKYDHV